MSGFIEGENRHQSVLFPESLDDYISEDSAVRIIDVLLRGGDGYYRFIVITYCL